MPRARFVTNRYTGQELTVRVEDEKQSLDQHCEIPDWDAVLILLGASDSLWRAAAGLQPWPRMAGKGSGTCKLRGLPLDTLTPHH